MKLTQPVTKLYVGRNLDSIKIYYSILKIPHYKIKS